MNTTQIKNVIDSFRVDKRIIADHLEMSHGTLNSIVEGKATISFDIVEKFTEKLNVNSAYLFGQSEDMFMDPDFKPEKMFPERKVPRVSDIKKGINPDVCNRVRKIRRDMDLTQTEFAEKMKSERHIQSSIENYRQNPTMYYLQLLRNNLGVNLNYVVTGLGSPFKVSEEVSSDEVDELKKRLAKAEALNDFLLKEQKD